MTRVFLWRQCISGLCWWGTWIQPNRSKTKAYCERSIKRCFYDDFKEDTYPQLQCCGSGSEGIRIKFKGRIRIRIKVISWMRIRTKWLDPDPHKVISWIQIRFNLQITSQNVWKIREYSTLYSRLAGGAGNIQGLRKYSRLAGGAGIIPGFPLEQEIF